MLNTTFKKLTENLPHEAVEAVLEFRQRVDRWMNGPETSDDHEMARCIVIFYRNAVPKAFPFIHETAKIRNLDSSEQMVWYNSEIDRIITEVQDRLVEEEIKKITDGFDLNSGDSFGLAKLNDDEKANVHRNIKKIREIIEISEISDRKRNALFERLNALSAEVDLHGTRTDRFFAFMADAAFAASNMTKNAKPFLAEVKDMVKTIGRSRARQEGVSLPPGDEVLQLPSPKDI